MEQAPLPIRTLLIVEDDQDLLEVLVAHVSQLGYNTLAADDGDKALALFDNNEIHAVLCDLLMPVMDGLTLLTNVRQKGQNVPFIFLTGYKNPDNLLKAIRLGSFDFIEKPVQFNVIEAAIQRCLDVGARLMGIEQALERLSREHPDLTKPIREIQRSMAQVSRLRGKD